MPAPDNHIVEFGGNDGVTHDSGVELDDHHLLGAVRRNGLHHALSVLPYERGVVEIEFGRRVTLDSLDGQRAARSHNVAVGGIGGGRNLDDRQRRLELRGAVVVVGNGHRQRERRGERGGAVTLILPELLSEPHSHVAFQPDVAVRVTSEATVAVPMPVTVKGSSNEPPGFVAIDLMSALSATVSFSEAPTVTKVWAVVERLFLLSVTVSVTVIFSPSGDRRGNEFD